MFEFINNFIEKSKKTFQSSYREFRESGLLPSVIVLSAFVFITSILIFWLEHPKNPQFIKFFDSFWYLIITITTTGYGDIVPTTVLGRLVGMMVMFSGVIMLSVLAGTVSSILVARKIKEAQGLQEIKQKGHILVCGWNVNVENIITTLREAGEKGNIVLINELPENEINNVLYKFKQMDVTFVRGDFSQEEILLRANCKNAKAAIVVPDEQIRQRANPDERTILATLTLKTLNPKLRVFAHLVDENNKPHLRRANADGILVSDEYSGFLLANHILSPGVPQAIHELLRYNESYEFYRADIPKEFVGKNFDELFDHYRKERRAIIIGIGSEEKGISIGDVLSSDTTSYLDEFIKRKFAESGKKIGEEKIKVHINPPDKQLITEKDFIIVISEERPT